MSNKRVPLYLLDSIREFLVATNTLAPDSPLLDIDKGTEKEIVDAFEDYVYFYVKKQNNIAHLSSVSDKLDKKIKKLESKSKKSKKIKRLKRLRMLLD